MIRSHEIPDSIHRVSNSAGSIVAGLEEWGVGGFTQSYSSHETSLTALVKGRTIAELHPPMLGGQSSDGEETERNKAAQPPPRSSIIKNSTGIDFVDIPAGAFTMGEGKEVHRVTICRPFGMGKYQVTQHQWEAVMGRYPSRKERPEHPITQITWDEVQIFIGRLNSLEGDGQYRLPTEEEWEYACRAGSNTAIASAKIGAC